MKYERNCEYRTGTGDQIFTFFKGKHFRFTLVEVKAYYLKKVIKLCIKLADPRFGLASFFILSIGALLAL